MIHKIKKIFTGLLLWLSKLNFIHSFIPVIYKVLGHQRFSKIVFNIIFHYWYKIAPSYQQKSLNSSPRLMWGHIPILNNKYWSQALQEAGFESKTLMYTFYEAINTKEDFDLYIDDIIQEKYGHLPALITQNFKMALLFDYVLKNFNILHLTCHGTSLQSTPYSDAAVDVIKRFGIKTIVMPYGSDFQQYSKITNISFRHALLINYPEAAKKEAAIKQDVDFWTKHADIFLSGVQVDGLARWDLVPYNQVIVDTKTWKAKNSYLQKNGIDQKVTVVHTPNHRGVKGSEYLIKAVDELNAEGYLIELILVEKMQNSKVRELLQEKADILVSQLIYGVYALSAIEGMSCGLPVLTNLDFEPYAKAFRRYSYLNECPILSTTPENVKENLKIIVTNPQLREELGRAGRAYAEKYHSYETAQYTFGKIYDKIWYGKDIDLMNMFHPAMPDSYNNSKPLIEHPLEENKLPQALREKLLTTANQKTKTHE